MSASEPPMQEPKRNLYAFLGKRKLGTPVYDVKESSWNGQKRFRCELQVPNMKYVAKSSAISKKEATADAARDFMMFLIREGHALGFDFPGLLVDDDKKEDNEKKNLQAEAEDFFPGYSDEVDDPSGAGGYDYDNGYGYEHPTDHADDLEYEQAVDYGQEQTTAYYDQSADNYGPQQPVGYDQSYGYGTSHYNQPPINPPAPEPVDFSKDDLEEFNASATVALSGVSSTKSNASSSGVSSTKSSAKPSLTPAPHADDLYTEANGYTFSNSKKSLNEFSQKVKVPPPVYDTMASIGSPGFDATCILQLSQEPQQITGYGHGSSKKIALALSALSVLNQLCVLGALQPCL